MISLRLAADAVGDARLEALPLPFAFAGPTATERDQSLAPAPEVARQYTSLRAVVHPDEAQDATRKLVVLVSGEIQVEGSYQRATLRPGDVLLLDEPPADKGTVTYAPGTRTVEVGLADEWRPGGSTAPVTDEERRGAADEPRLTEMYVADDVAHFRDLGTVFPGSPEPLLAASFLGLSPGLVSDWHTEKGIGLVVVLSGGFELEVGGSGGAQVFRAGDVCLVDDRVGQGHITRTHGETRFLHLVVADDHGLLG
jgi:quercetin dioxygenase-like cupin family protein